MQKRSAAARWEKLTQEERSKQMRTLRLKRVRRKYVLMIVQDHRPNQPEPFSVEVRGRNRVLFDVRGKNLFRILNEAAEAICAREEEATSPENEEPPSA
jgi:hypothetical protein